MIAQHSLGAAQDCAPGIECVITLYVTNDHLIRLTHCLLDTCTQICVQICGTRLNECVDDATAESTHKKNKKN